MKIFTRIALSLLFVLSVSAVSAQTAAFTATPTSGCAPLVVSFTDGSTPGGVIYYWDFGNGFNSYLTNPSTSYLTPGTYTVILKVTYPGGIVVTHTETITVYPPPTVSFTVSDTSVCPGTPIVFTSTTLGGVPGAISYTWSFGDGYTSTLPNPTHAYSTPGYYNITLTATNSMGCVATLTLYSYIHVFNPPVPTFAAAVTYFCRLPAHAVFTSYVSGAAPYTYSWRFGDGGTSTAPSPIHDYTATGTYPVTLVVTDANGCSDSVTRSGYIVVVHNTAGFIPVTDACVGATVTFTDTSSAHSTANWSYGDGGTSTGDPGRHAWGAPGTYPVTLVVGSPPCLDTVVHMITIHAGPVATFTITPANPCPPPTTLTFSTTAPPGTLIRWIYGDGGSGTTGSHTYGAAGTYVISMIVTDPVTGCTDTVTQTKTIYDLYLVTIASPRNGCVPLNVTFTTLAYYAIPCPGPSPCPYPWPIASYTWNFGDGSSPSSSYPGSHTYTAIGTYTATVTAITSNGCTVSNTVIVNVGAPPVVTFTATPTHECYHGNLITFNVTVISGPVDSLYWNFGDGSGPGGIPTTHHYDIPGVFTVTVIPYYHGCPGPPVVRPNYIIIDSPKAIINYTALCSPQGRVNFGDSSMGDDTHVWMFGDATTSTADNPVHDYSPLAVYTVSLATYNVRSGCRDTSTVVIDLSRPVVSFTADRTGVCKWDTVTFTPVITSGSVTGFHWSAWSGSYGTHGWPVPLPRDSLGYTFSDSFFTTGIYNVRLIFTDQNGCLDTVIRTNYVTVAKPVANFIAVPTSGCWPLYVLFSDASTDVPGVALSTYDWAFGDGGTAVVGTPSVAHTFTAAGTFTTTEIVTDALGCKDTVALPLVTVYRPRAAFNASTTYPCRNDVVTFTNTSTASSPATITSSYWWFGDGTTSTTTSPTHSYSLPGVYTVRLAVTDSRGCTDTAVYTSYINVTEPVASFYMTPDSVSICPPLLVYFINTSTGAVFYNWSFGDGTFSTAASPSDLYTTTGYDTVMLIATNMYGCKDTAYGHVNIFGYAGAFTYGPDTGCAPLVVHFRASLSNVPNIIWDFSDGHTSAVSMTDTITHVYSLPGAYVPKLILSDNTGCQNSSQGLDTIRVDLVTTDFATGPVCLNGTAQFSDSSKSYWSTITSWNWTFNNGDVSSLANPTYMYTTVGTYPVTLTATDGWGCTATIVKNIDVFAPPVITASGDTTICLGDAAKLTGYGGVSYTWAPPGTLSCTACNPAMASPTVATTYTVTGRDAHSCANTDTVQVLIKTKTISKVKGDTAICRGSTVPLLDSGGTKYTWIPSSGLNNSNIANPLAKPTQTTTYMAIAKLASCIADTNYVTVVVHQLPTVDAGPDQRVLAGTTAQIVTTGSLISAYEWKDASTLSCDSCANPVASMSVSTTYFVTVTSDFGCKNGDSVRILVFCDQSQLFIPNAFTPNGDGQNDVFYPRGTGVKTIKTFRIYNRWGEMLFERMGIDVNDASNAWDGSYRGGTPRPDVYVYIIEAVCETGEPINVKGDVTVIR
jgi:gliding motility-associated-like protein